MFVAIEKLRLEQRQALFREVGKTLPRRRHFEHSVQVFAFLHLLGARMASEPFADKRATRGIWLRTSAACCSSTTFVGNRAASTSASPTKCSSSPATSSPVL